MQWPVDATDLSDLIANQRSIYIIRWEKTPDMDWGRSTSLYRLYRFSAARQNDQAVWDIKHSVLLR